MITTTTAPINIEKEKKKKLKTTDVFLPLLYISEKYFDMNKKQCKDGLECYKRFLVRMDSESTSLCSFSFMLRA
jgi:hypothetical protein